MKPTGLKIINNTAYLNGFNLVDVAKEYGTPLYVMDEKEINQKIEVFKESFKGSNFVSMIVYASKAFLTPYMASIIDKHNLFMDSVSLGDLYVMLKSGFNSKQIVFHGNNKSLEELEYAIDNNIGLIVVDNLFELQLLEKTLMKKEKKQDILIRINPGISAHTHKYIQTSKLTSKFGESIYDENIIDKLMQIVINSNHIVLRGFHSHIGSQIHEIEPFIKEIDKMISFQNRVSQKYNYVLDTLNLGGGFGIKYTLDEKNIELCEVLKVLSKQIDDRIIGTTINKIMIEPGRSIVGNAGITLYECSQIKHTYGGKNYLFINGGMTDNIRPALYEAIYECDVANKMNEKKDTLVDVVGKCCESGDIIRNDVMIPKIESGDFLIVYATGAYNYSMSSNYNNMLKPAVIMIDDKITLVSRKELLSDLYRLF